MRQLPKVIAVSSLTCAFTYLINPHRLMAPIGDSALALDATPPASSLNALSKNGHRHRGQHCPALDLQFPQGIDLHLPNLPWMLDFRHCLFLLLSYNAGDQLTLFYLLHTHTILRAH